MAVEGIKKIGIQNMHVRTYHKQSLDTLVCVLGLARDFTSSIIHCYEYNMAEAFLQNTNNYPTKFEAYFTLQLVVIYFCSYTDCNHVCGAKLEFSCYSTVSYTLPV